MGILLERIKTFLKEKNLTNRSFAQSLGANEKTIGNKLRGTRDFDASDLMSILETFKDLSAEWLFRGEGSMLRYEEEKKHLEQQIEARLNAEADFIEARWQKWIEARVKSEVAKQLKKEA